MNKLVINCDGASRGNPGHAAAAFIVQSEGEVIAKHSEYLGVKTNNFAEYKAVLLAMEWLNSFPKSLPGSVIFYLDSELVVKQLNGLYKIKSRSLLPLFQKIKTLANSFAGEIKFVHQKREQNAQADALANKALDKFLGSVI
jgi:ribonuclease HI